MNSSIAFQELKKKKKFSPEIIEHFQREFGDVFFRALELLHNGGIRIEKHFFSPSNLIVWSVSGDDNEYLIFPGLYCQCKAFTIETIYGKKQYFPCKHLLSIDLADILGTFEKILHKDLEWIDWLKNFK